MLAAPPSPSPSGSPSVLARVKLRRPGVEAAFRDALVESLAALPLRDHNLLRFHYFRGLRVDQLAQLFATQRGAMARQLERIHDRLLRDTERGLAVRLPHAGTDLGPDLARVLGAVRSNFEHAIALVLRS
jgi:hypothetical protein